jgi:hypothetical protein
MRCKAAAVHWLTLKTPSRKLGANAESIPDKLLAIVIWLAVLQIAVVISYPRACADNSRHTSWDRKHRFLDRVVFINAELGKYQNPVRTTATLPPELYDVRHLVSIRPTNADLTKEFIRRLRDLFGIDTYQVHGQSLKFVSIL